MEVNNILIAKNYNIWKSERVPRIMNWLGCEGIHFVPTLVDDKQEICKSSAGLFSIHNTKFKPQNNENILSLQYCKLDRDENEMS